jgi:hypothetical protein
MSNTILDLDSDDDNYYNPITIKPCNNFLGYKLTIMIQKSGLSYDTILKDLNIGLGELRDMEKGLFNINDSNQQKKYKKMYQRIKKYIDDYNKGIY